jgi:SAM-dependent methyltransferase
VRGYTSSSYGDAFADVYDDWYRTVSDVESTVATLVELASAASAATTPERAAATVLELGVGTGRLAIPLAAAGAAVTGVDASAAMLRRLTEKDPDGHVQAVLGDMVDDVPRGPFDVVFVAYNTLFNLLTRDRQQACFAAVRAVLAPEGSFVVEAFVPSPQPGSQVTVRSLDADRVVLSISVHDGDDQRAEGQYVELTEAAGVRLRPWSIRYASPDELDEMAAAAGLVLRARWGDFDRRPFTDESDRHVSVYVEQIT